MQVPYRKPGKYSQIKSDPLMTKEKLLSLERKLLKLKSARPALAAEVARLAELGDFSENAEYQLAKGKLRGLNSAILSLDHQINNAEVFEQPIKTDEVMLGSTVTVVNEKGQLVFQILGSVETNPNRGVISLHSPLGQALLGKKVGESAVVKLANKEIKYKIVSIK